MKKITERIDPKNLHNNIRRLKKEFRERGSFEHTETQ